MPISPPSLPPSPSPGCGIPPEQREQIFESFYQVDSSSTRTQSGSGLGLFIVRGLVSLMGGQVAVADKEGPGTLIRFSVRLPPVAAASANGNGMPPGSFQPPPAPMSTGYVTEDLPAWQV